MPAFMHLRRHQLYHGYKAQRPAVPDGIINAIPRILEVLQVLVLASEFAENGPGTSLEVAVSQHDAAKFAQACRVSM